MSEIARILQRLEADAGQPAVLATLVEVDGSSYRRPGARLLVLPDGSHCGSISGGCLEADVVERARAVLQNNRSAVATYDTTSENEQVWGVGLGCRGVVRVLLEPIAPERPRWIKVLGENLAARNETALAVVHEESAGRTLLAAELNGSADKRVFREVISPAPSLVVFGAGDDVQPLVTMAAQTGWHVTVADVRAAQLSADRFPRAHVRVVAPVERLVAEAGVNRRSSVVVMTHRYREDVVLLRGLLAREPAYLGVLGPRTRTDRLLNDLAAAGDVPSPAARAALHAPVGLDLGATTPEAIALSILAELQGCLANRPPINLRDRMAPIHG